MLFAGIYDWLVEQGPLDALYWQRLPDVNTDDRVAVAVLTTAGAGATKYLGSRPVAVASKPWLTHDAGVRWFHTGLIFQARAEKGYELAATVALDDVRDRMLMLVDGPFTVPENANDPPYDDWDAYGIEGGVERETLYWAEVTNPPNLLEQDTQERLVHQLLMEVWHKPARSA